MLAPPVEPTPAGPDVRLGFDDGTEVQLAPNDPRAQALRHVADVLLEGGSS